MAIITFMSDFGHRDHYVSAVKARVLSINPNIKIVDITHSIEHFNIPHAAFVLRSVFRDFPKGTVHLVSVNTSTSEKNKMIAIKLEEHYFVGADNGLFSLLSDKEPTAAVELRPDTSYSSVFPDRSVLAQAAVSLASGITLYNLGKEIPELKKMRNRQLKINKEQIGGHVIHVDTYGNLITNISREVFDKMRDGRNYSIHFGMETLDNLVESYDSVDHGDALAMFNSNGYLEIAICEGNGSSLLGLSYDSPVMISFQG